MGMRSHKGDVTGRKKARAAPRRYASLDCTWRTRKAVWTLAETQLYEKGRSYSKQLPYFLLGLLGSENSTPAPLSADRCSSACLTTHVPFIHPLLANKTRRRPQQA